MQKTWAAPHSPGLCLNESAPLDADAAVVAPAPSRTTQVFCYPQAFAHEFRTALESFKRLPQAVAHEIKTALESLKRLSYGDLPQISFYVKESLCL